MISRNYLNQKKPFIIAAFFVVCLWIFVHTIPFLRFGVRAFGYDFGIYRRIIPFHAAEFFSGTMPEFGFSFLSNVWVWMGLSPNAILLGWYGAIFVLIAIAWYALVRAWSKINSTALVATALFAFSIAQYQFFLWFYFRNAVGILAVLVALLLIQKKSWLAVLPLILAGTVHSITLVPIFPALALWAMCEKNMRRFLFPLLAISGAAIIVLNWPEFFGYLKFIFSTGIGASAAAAIGRHEFSGQFLSAFEFIRAAIWYLPFALVGMFRYWKKEIFWSALGLICILGAVFQILFFRRMFLWLDFVLLYFAARFFADWFAGIRSRKETMIPAALYGVILCVAIGIALLRSTPTIDAETFADLTTLNTLPRDASILAINSRLSPWVYGYSTQTVLAPGVFDDNVWNESEWNIFWYSNDQFVRPELLNRYQSPVYLFLGRHGYTDLRSDLASDPLFTPLSESLWKYSSLE